jgi:hypothetical protein
MRYRRGALADHFCSRRPVGDETATPCQERFRTLLLGGFGVASSEAATCSRVKPRRLQDLFRGRLRSAITRPNILNKFKKIVLTRFPRFD